MTITIADGRGALWQWDTGRRLRVGSGVEQIHYQNRALGCSVDVDVGTDGTAIIPDELLQDCHTLTAYAYVTDDTGAYTMVQQDFAVHKRAKPAGYVYTPTDQMTLQTIQHQIGDLADLTTEAKDTLVAAINEVALMGGRMSLRVADGYIQYSTDSGSTWKNLIAVAELKGSDGITPHIGDNGNWYLGTTDTGKPSRGDPGAPGIYYGTTQPTGDTHPVWIDPDGGPDDGGLLPAVTAADNGKVLRVVSSAWAAEDMPTGGTDMGITGAAVGQIAKITAVDDSGKPTAWSPVDMPGGGSGGHWETVLDTVWEQDVINPTAFDSETGIFTCAEGELNNLELNKEYIFFQQCAVEGAAYNTILSNDVVKVTKLSDTTFSIDVTPPTTFVPTNVKFSKGARLAVTDIDAKKIRLTLDGQFHPTATLYDRPFYRIEHPYFGKNTGYAQIRNAYQAYQQVTAEVESPYRIVGEILCGFNAPSATASFHFKNNSFCCPLIPYDVPEGTERNSLLTSDGTKIAKLYSSNAPWAPENLCIGGDYLKIISGTKVKLERWVE